MDGGYLATRKYKKRAIGVSLQAINTDKHDAVTLRSAVRLFLEKLNLLMNSVPTGFKRS